MAPQVHKGALSASLTVGEIASIYASARKNTSSDIVLDIEVKKYLSEVLPSGVTLLEHQERALAWMLLRERAGTGGVLADEPGLGKTLTTLCLAACQTRQNSRYGGTLVITPTTAVRAQWMSESERFFDWTGSGDGSSVTLYEGVAKPYSKLLAEAEIEKLTYSRVALCDLATLRREHHLFEAECAGRAPNIVAPLFAVEWARVVVDEIQDVEARSSISAKAVRRLPCRYRWGVSGTPIARGSLEALRGLLEFTNSSPYCDSGFWFSNIARPLSTGVPEARANALAIVRAAAAEHMWRTQKSDVGSSNKFAGEKEVGTSDSACPPRSKKARLEIKPQHIAPVVVVEPGAAEVAATRPALEQLLASAVKAARRAGFQGDDRELTSRDVRTLLASGAASSKSSLSVPALYHVVLVNNPKADTATVTRPQATAVSLLDDRKKLGKFVEDFRGHDRKSMFRSKGNLDAETEIRWVCCDVCQKWRQIPATVIIDEKEPWFCGQSRGWGDPGYVVSCESPEYETSSQVDANDIAVKPLAIIDPFSLDAALSRCTTRCSIRVGATAASLANMLVNKARHTGRVRPCAEVIALLLAALCVARHGCPPDELEACRIGAGAPVETTANVKASLPAAITAATLERLETEARRLAVFADDFTTVASPPGNDEDEYDDTETEKRAALLHAARRALYAERSSRRIATAMAAHERLGNKSPAKLIPQQVWQKQIWMFVDGGAGDFVAELVDRSRELAGRRDGNLRAKVAALDLDQRLIQIPSGVSSVNYDADDEPLFDASFRVRPFAEILAPAAATVAQIEEDDDMTWRAREVSERLRWDRLSELDKRLRRDDAQALHGMRRVLGGGKAGETTKLTPVNDPDDRKSDPGGAARALRVSSPTRVPTSKSRIDVAEGGDSDMLATQDVARRIADALMEPYVTNPHAISWWGGSTQGYRATSQRVKEVVEWIADPRRQKAVGAHEDQLVAHCRRWVHRTPRQRNFLLELNDVLSESNRSMESLANAIALEGARLAQQCAVARLKALAAARRVAIDISLGRYDAIDADAALRKETPNGPRSGRRAVAPAPARLDQHAVCLTCSSGAWRTFESRRAISNWGRCQCALCAARKRARIFRAYVTVARSDEDSALVRLIKALAGPIPKASPPGPHVVAGGRAAVAELKRCQEDAEAALAVVRDADTIATASIQFRRTAFAVPSAVHYSGLSPVSSSYPGAVNRTSVDSIARLVFQTNEESMRRKHRVRAVPCNGLQRRHFHEELSSSERADDDAETGVRVPTRSSEVRKMSGRRRRKPRSICNKKQRTSASSLLRTVDCRMGRGSNNKRAQSRCTEISTLLDRVHDERQSLISRVALASCILDPEATVVRVALDEAIRSSIFTRVVESARCRRLLSVRQHCTACQTIGDGSSWRVTRNCAHIICGNCARETSIQCPTCAALHSEPMSQQPLIDARGPEFAHSGIPDYGSKIDRVCQFIQHIAAKSEKCLVFSSWVDALELLQVALESRKVKSLVMRNASNVPQILRVFRTNPDCTALLLSLRTSNAGLNISEASTVIMLDSGLDIGLETQALARVQRIDSGGESTVYRFIAQGSLESAIWQLRSSTNSNITRGQVYDLLVDQHRRAL